MTETGLPPGLWLIGLGPGNLEYMSKYANEVANACSRRYLEGYTAILPPQRRKIRGRDRKMGENYASRC